MGGGTANEGYMLESAQPSSSQWGFLIVFVKKRTGLCVFLWIVIKKRNEVTLMISLLIVCLELMIFWTMMLDVFLCFSYRLATDK